MQVADLGPLAHPDHLLVLLAASTRRPCLAPSIITRKPLFPSAQGVPFHVATGSLFILPLPGHPPQTVQNRRSRRVSASAAITSKEEPMDWHSALPAIVPHVVKIETPDGGHGTGFLRRREAEWYAIATAKHVVAHAHKWRSPIQVTHGSEEPFTLDPSGTRCAILARPEADVAIVVSLDVQQIGLWPTAPLALVPDQRFVHTGSPIGWLGYPHPYRRRCDATGRVVESPPAPLALVPDQRFVHTGSPIGWLGYPHLVDGGNRLCFFSGSVSAFSQPAHRYFIDGVAIHGVSGGPAFVMRPEQGTLVPYVLGMISQYWPNRANGEAQPGVAVAEDVSQLHQLDTFVAGIGT